jgi:osmoprotectant transport system ATP-binding protein
MIALENVTKQFPDGTTAVKDVSFEIHDGEICVLLGPSGCGKTTTMKMINRLITITSGRILIDGVDNLRMDETEIRRNIGYTIQEIGLFPHMTVGQNIEIVPSLKGWPKAKRRARAEELLRLVRLDPAEYIDRYPSELSGGQRQRIGVARSLGADPPILLMDEPFGAIDPITRVDLQTEFLKIQDQIKKTIIFVTHDIYEAIKMGDKIALMRNGELVQYDTPANLIYQPKDEFVEGFIGADRAVKGLQLIRVDEVMEASVSAAPDEESGTLLPRLRDSGQDALTVVGDGGFIGLANLEALQRGGAVGDVVNRDVATISRSAVLDEALSLILSSGLKVLPVVDGGNRLRGILTFDSIQKALRRAAGPKESE